MEVVKKFKISLQNDEFVLFCKENESYLKQNFEDFSLKLKKENLDLLFLNLSDNYKDQINSFYSVNDDLRVEYKIETALDHLKFREIEKFASLLKGIDFLILKGIALAGYLKMSVYKRTYDVDILIKRKDVQSVIDKLTSSGYQLIPAFCNGEFSVISPKQVPFDIHYDLTASSPFVKMSNFNYSEVKGHLQLKTLGAFKYYTFDPSLTFLYLCVHWAINHQFNNFILFYEIKKFVEFYKSEIDWSNLQKISNRMRLLYPLYLCSVIMELEDLIQFKIPDAKKQKYLAFIEQKSILFHLLQGTNNLITTNEIPMLCVNSMIDRHLFNRGNKIWNKKKNKLSFPF